MLLLACGCGDGRRSNGGSPRDGGPDGTVDGAATSAHVSACRDLFATGLPDPDSSAVPSFARDLLPLFVVHCNFGGCHLGEDTSGQLRLGEQCDLDLRTGACAVDASGISPTLAAVIHGNLLARSNAAPNLPRVTPGDPGRSFILMKLSGCDDAFPDVTGCTSCGSVMPPDTPLRTSNPALFDLIARWVVGGAPLD